MRTAVSWVCVLLSSWLLDLSDRMLGVDTTTHYMLPEDAMRALAFCADLSDLEDGEVIPIEEYERRIRLGMQAATWH